MQELIQFMRAQKLLQIAPAGADPWIATVYMGCEAPDRLYFIGSEEAKYGAQLLIDERLAFATAWHDKHNHKNRKGVQGVGTCVIAVDEADITTGITLHNQHYPEFADRITRDWIDKNDQGSHVWVITPTFIKYWDDEAYGDNEFREFNF